MAHADDQAYEEMINALQKFLRDLDEECQVMSAAGEDCVDNTDGDPAAVTSNEKLQGCISRIQSAEEEIQRIIVAISQEMEDIRESAARVSY